MCSLNVFFTENSTGTDEDPEEEEETHKKRKISKCILLNVLATLKTV